MEIRRRTRGRSAALLRERAADSVVPEQAPVCVYLEVTNRCNLLCETCPRTFEALEPPADMSWELFTSIVDQMPGLTRAVLHGVGEPMLVKNLPRMIRYLKERGIYVLFNTNGTLLAPKNAPRDYRNRSRRAAGLPRRGRGGNFFQGPRQEHLRPHCPQCAQFTHLQKEIGAATPRVSLWLTGLRETVEQLPDFVRLAARIGVREVYLQRLVFDDLGRGLAREDSSLFERPQGEEAAESPRRRRSAGRSASRSTPRVRPSPASA